MKTRDRGSAAVEAAIVFPCLLLVGVLAFAVVRTTTARAQVTSAARAAARAASVADGPGDASERASTVALSTLGEESACRSDAVTSVSGFEAGGNVTVTVSCTTDPVFGFLVGPRKVSATAVEAVSGVRGGLE